VAVADALLLVGVLVGLADLVFVYFLFQQQVIQLQYLTELLLQVAVTR
jgi:hypothetical protein